MDEPWGHAKWNSVHRKTVTPWFLLHEVSKIVKFIESKSEMIVVWHWGERENGELLINGQKVSVKQDE